MRTGFMVKSTRCLDGDSLNLSFLLCPSGCYKPPGAIGCLPPGRYRLAGLGVTSFKGSKTQVISSSKESA